jgi:hypothetical protein
MRLLEELRRGPILARGVPLGYLDTAVALLEDAVPVLVDNVARWYGEESPQEQWELNTDFPNVAPPWPVAFYEWSSPRWLNRGGVREWSPEPGTVCGMLVWARPLDMVPAVEQAQNTTWLAAQERALQESAATMLPQLLKLGPQGIWAALPADVRARYIASYDETALATLGLTGGWWCQAWTFVKLRGYPAAYVGGYSYPISAAGQFVETPHHPGTYLYGIDAPLFSLAIAEKMHADGMAPLHVPLLATSFCHCKNVVLRDDVPPPKLAAAQFKRHGAPKITYKTLEIGPMLGTLQTEGGMNQGNTAQKALHICRGHFMDYREGAGLFGKHHGLYWKDMHVRGRNRQGVVIKDYAIATPEKEPA